MGNEQAEVDDLRLLYIQLRSNEKRTMFGTISKISGTMSLFYRNYVKLNLILFRTLSEQEVRSFPVQAPVC